MIKLILGPMFSGKSSEMVRLLVRAQIAGKKVVFVRPSIDDRGFISRDNKEIDMDIISMGSIKYDELKDYDVIGLDEAQFYNNDRDYLNVINKLANEKEVIISALNGTSERGQFKNVQELIPYAEEIIKLNAICTECGSEYGAYSYFKAGDKTEKVTIGDEEYTALCRKCYNDKLRRLL